LPLCKNAGSNNLENFGRVAKIWVDPKTNEAYIADGYTNKRVAVVDADTGKMKRYWARTAKADDAPLGNYDPKAPTGQQFRNRCIASNARTTAWSTCATARATACSIPPDGTFVKEGFLCQGDARFGLAPGISRSRRIPGSASCSSRRPEREGAHQYCARRWRRFLTRDGGRQPGQFYGVHSIASDSKGHLTPPRRTKESACRNSSTKA